MILSKVKKINNLKHKSATFVVYNTKSVLFTTLMAGIHTLWAYKKIITEVSMKYETILVENPLKSNEGEPEYFYVIKKKGKIILKINVFSENSAFEDFKETVPIQNTITDELIDSIISNLNNELSKKKH